MVGKDEELGDIDDESLARVRLIAEKKRQLEETADQVRQEIKNCFERLTEVLRGREKQLLRQVEAVNRQQISLVQSNSELLQPTTPGLNANLSGEQELTEQLLSFGKIDLSNGIVVNDSEPYKAEEYQEAGEDYVSFDKSLKTESEELDVSSVIRRRKRDSSGSASKAISISLNCTSCESCKFETDQITVSATTTKKFDDSPVTPSSSSGKSPFKESEDEISGSAEGESPAASEKAAQSENFYFEYESGNNVSCSIADENNDDASKAATDDECTTVKAQDKAVDGGTEHPIQIQQWLKQILAETETEPIIHEIGQFSKIPNTRLYREFPVET